MRGAWDDDIAHPRPLPQAGGEKQALPKPPPACGRGCPESPLPLAGGVGGGPVGDRATAPGTGQFKPRNTARAQALRNQATPAERLLWTALSNRKVGGHKFSRQMPVGPFFADFLSREARMVVELDGFSHDMNQEYDRRRDTFMAEKGLTVLRFSNADVMGNLEGVVQAIALALAERCPPPTPPASGRGVSRASLEGSVG